MWKNLFLKLFRSNDPDPIPMWGQFQHNKLLIEDFVNTSSGDVIDGFDGLKAKVKKIAETTSDVIVLVENLEKDPDFVEEYWKSLFLQIRDRECVPLDKTKTIPIIVGGHERNLNMDDLEQIFLEENPDLLVTQTCVPDYQGTGDMEHITSPALKNKLKKMHDCDVQDKLGQKDMSKMKEAEKECYKKSVKKQALIDLKKTWEANMLQKQQADIAEVNVQEAIYTAVKNHGIVATVLRGIETYEQVGKFLDAFGIKCSKFGNLVKRRDDATRETEHDVVVVGLLSTGVFATFVQVENEIFCVRYLLFSAGKDR